MTCLFRPLRCEQRCAAKIYAMMGDPNRGRLLCAQILHIRGHFMVMLFDILSIG